MWSVKGGALGTICGFWGEPDNLYYWLGMYSESLCSEEKPTGSVTGPSSESGCGSGCDSDGGSGLEFAGLDEPVLWSG